MIGCADCPSCGDLLVGFTLKEAFGHLQTCCTEEGYYVLGMKPSYADEIYEQITGEEPPRKNQMDRIKWYLETAQT